MRRKTPARRSRNHDDLPLMTRMATDKQEFVVIRVYPRNPWLIFVFVAVGFA
jgi:hypothetical protein